MTRLMGSPLTNVENLVDAFAHRARERADHFAIRAEDGEVSYRELHDWARHIAGAFTPERSDKRGVVAVLANQGLHSIVGLLGGLHAGRCVLPLDPKQPVGRLRAIIEDADCRVILTRKSLRREATDLVPPGAEILSLDEISCMGAAESPDITLEPDSAAVLLYTSGSTGRPKGVLHTHRSLLQNTMRHTELFEFHHADHQTLLYPSGVYGGTRDIFNALLNGACLYQRDVRRAGTVGLADWLRQSGITVYCSVVTVFRHMVRSLPADLILDEIRAVKLGGEAPQPRDIEAFRKHFSKDARLHCGLASTETGATFHFLIGPDTPIDSTRVPLGTPIRGVDVRVIDAKGDPVPDGGVGELEVKSSSIARGYLHSTASDSKAFGICAWTGERSFRTGDLVCKRADGLFEHRGRNDLQVKVRGNRVEIFEVEQAIESLAQVREAAVVPVAGPHGQQLVACVVLQPSQSTPVHTEELVNKQEFRRINPQPLMDALRLFLSGHKIPSRYLAFTKLPQTSNGKLDRQRITQLVLESANPTLSEIDEVQTLPSERIDIERQLSGIWQDLLVGAGKINIDISRHDNFFELGGHSLLAMEMLIRVELAFGARLPLSVLMEAPSIAQFAFRISEPSLADTSAPPVILIPTDGIPHASKQHRPFFCTHAIGGEVMYLKPLADMLGPTQPIYGFQSIGVDPGHYDSVQALAKQYVAAMRAIQPTGPYRLGGYSFGGSIALEIAQQLVATGQSVGTLVIFDHAPRNTPDRLPSRSPVSIAQKLANIPYWIVDDLFRTPPKRVVVGAYGQCKRAISTLTSKLPRRTSTPTNDSTSDTAITAEQAAAQALDVTGRMAPDFNPAAYFRVTRLDPKFAARVIAHLTANRSYLPKEYDGHVLVFKARTGPFLYNRQLRRSWCRLAKSCRFVTLPGAHSDLFRRQDSLRIIARELQQELARDSQDTIPVA